MRRYGESRASDGRSDNFGGVDFDGTIFGMSFLEADGVPSSERPYLQFMEAYHDFTKLKIGIQAVRVENPDGTLEGVEPHIPWDNPTCAVRSPLLEIEPVRVRRSDALLSPSHMAQYPGLFGGIDYTAGFVCTHKHRQLHGIPELSNFWARMSLRRAVGCVAHDTCYGISLNMVVENAARYFQETRMEGRCTGKAQRIYDSMESGGLLDLMILPIHFTTLIRKRVRKQMCRGLR